MVDQPPAPRRAVLVVGENRGTSSASRAPMVLSCLYGSFC
jgi:hypothetical protein